MKITIEISDSDARQLEEAAAHELRDAKNQAWWFIKVGLSLYGKTFSDWRELFDERELKEIEYNQLYLTSFNHGTNSHLERTIIAKFAKISEDYLALLRTEHIPQ